MEKDRFREWVIYGDWFQHPDGYSLKGLLTLGFESGPDLKKDEKVTVIEKSALEELLEIAEEMEEMLLPYIYEYGTPSEGEDQFGLAAFKKKLGRGE